MLVGVIGLRALAPIVFCSSAERPRALAGGSKFRATQTHITAKPDMHRPRAFRTYSSKYHDSNKDNCNNYTYSTLTVVPETENIHLLSFPML